MKDGQAYEDSGLTEETEHHGQETLTRASTAESRPLLGHRDTNGEASEESPLIVSMSRQGRGDYGISHENGNGADLEGQKYPSPKIWFGRTAHSLRDTGGRVAAVLPIIGNPKRWDFHALWRNAVVAPVACMPAVVVGLLLNILDALSYGEVTLASAAWEVH